MLYKFLKAYCRAALWFFYRTWQVREFAPVPEGPVIFVANHQNAFLDAVLVACSTKRNPWFLTRATVFEKPLARKILSALKMTPVYRFRDGFGTLRKNEVVIDRCSDLLAKKEAILIFGEGNHNEQWSLRPLQKGFARIALAAKEKLQPGTDVKIVPVGIQYEVHSLFRSRVLVSFGKALSLNEIVNTTDDAQKNIEAILDKTREQLIPLMLHLDPSQYEEQVNYLSSKRVVKKDLTEQLQHDQEIISSWKEGDPTSPSTTTSKFSFSVESIYYYINHILAILLIRSVIRSKVKDPQFIGSMKFVLGMVLIPVFYLLQSVVCYLISGSWLITLLYFISLPVSVALKKNSR